MTFSDSIFSQIQSSQTSIRFDHLQFNLLKSDLFQTFEQAADELSSLTCLVNGLMVLRFDMDPESAKVLNTHRCSAVQTHDAQGWEVGE